MSEAKTPIGEYITWLPGELEYSARKAGYDKKIKRAALPIEDRTSMYGFLGAEWDNHLWQKKQGAHYMPFHGMSAQLQLAKFAAGLFDKAAIATWLRSGTDATEANFLDAAQQTAMDAVDMLLLPDEVSDPDQILAKPFEQTPFAGGIAILMQEIVSVAGCEEADERFWQADRLNELAVDLGCFATDCYVAYAYSSLTVEQYTLPISQLTE